MKFFSNVGLVLIGLYLLVLGLVYVGQRALVFSASTERVTPSELGLEAMTEVALETKAGQRLYSWYAPAASGRPTLLYLQGNGGSISTRVDIQRSLLRSGYGLFMVGYPGYGGSAGRPSEPALVEAANLAYQHLTDSGVSPAKLVVFGESLGSAVAIQLARKVSVAAVVLAAPMYSIQEIAQAQYPFLPVAHLLKDPFLSYQYIADVQAPLLVLHGSRDQAIPLDSGRRLFALANEPKRFALIEGAGHNNLFDFGILDLLDAFLAQHLFAG